MKKPTWNLGVCGKQLYFPIFSTSLETLSLGFKPANQKQQTQETGVRALCDQLLAVKLCQSLNVSAF